MEIVNFCTKNKKFFSSFLIVCLLVIMVISCFYGSAIGTLADWVSGIGSVGAIIIVWWQSHEDVKRIKQERDEEIQENAKQEMRNYVASLNKIKFQLIGVNKFIQSLGYFDKNNDIKFNNVGLTEMKFIAAKVNEVTSLCHDDLSKIIEFKNKKNNFDHAENIEIQFSDSIMKSKYNLELKVLNFEKDKVLEAKEIHKCIYDVYHSIVKYTYQCACSECNEKKENKNINVLGREIDRVTEQINKLSA